MPFSYGNTEADGSLRVSVVDGLTYTGQFAADSSMNILVVDGSTYVGLIAPCGAVNVVLVAADQTGSVIHPSGALVCSVSPYYKNTVPITSTAPIVLDAPTLDWNDVVTNNLPVFTMTWDAAVGDVATLRRSATNDFAVYTDATDTIDSLAQILEFDFGDIWADGVWYVKSRYSRNAVNSDFSNTETVTIDTTADELAFDGAQAKLNADLTAQNITSLTLLAFNATDILDTNNWHDPVTNNTQITIPSGVSYVQFYGQVRIVNGTGNETLELTLRKNGSAAGLSTAQVSALMSYGGSNMSNQIVSYPMQVTAGDYFELQVQVQADTSVDLTGAYCWLAAMKVG